MSLTEASLPQALLEDKEEDKGLFALCGIGYPEKSLGLRPEAMGRSKDMRRVVREIKLVAPTRFTVLITGETGTGKEMVANAIHQSSPRGKGLFIPVDCGCIPATLIESELFGYEKGAYTGAVSSQPGKFEMASGGTLFLDEISSLPLSVQPKLLRALQERKVWRVGGRTAIDVDIRVVAATNQNLDKMVQEGRFRMDLYHRLNEFRVPVPPLRDRQEDIVLYAKEFLRLATTELGKTVDGFTLAALETLRSYSWPGNVRELRNVIRRAALCCDHCITPAHLNISAGSARSRDVQTEAAPRQNPDQSGLREIIRQTVKRMEREIIVEVLQQTGGNKAQAARILRVDYKTIHNKVRKYGISS